MPFMSLPVEVHEAIQQQLSLPSHVSLSQTCRDMREMYSESRWKLLTQASGFSRPCENPLDQEAEMPGWRVLAAGIVTHASKCGDKDCRDLVKIGSPGTPLAIKRT